MLQFWIEPGCTLKIRPFDAIMLVVRLEWTVKAFFEADGIGKFTDRMSAALGIHRADLKVVQVYEGSVIVQFQITTDDEENPIKTLKSLEETFKTVAPTLGDSLGAFIMQVVGSDGSIVAMKGYEDLSDLQNNKNFVNLISEFEESQKSDEIFIWDSYDDIIIEEETKTETSADDESTKDDTSPVEDPNTSTETTKVTEEKPRDAEEVTQTMNIVKTIVKTTITDSESSNNSQTLFLVIIVVILAVVVFSLLLCYFLNKQKAKLHIKESQVSPRST